jgi:hypothetical protein
MSNRTLGSIGPVYKESDWPELMALQEKHRTSPFHVHVDNNVPVLSQKNTNYCWMYGVVGGVMNRYASMDGVAPMLSAAGPASRGTRFQNIGGWGEQAVDYIREYGIPTTDVWPNATISSSLTSKPKVIESEKKHNLVQFENFGYNNFKSTMSALLCPYNSSPVSVGLSWWGHLVLALQAVRYQGQWGYIFVNSWDKTWGEGGYGVLLGDKAIPTESIAIKSIKPRRI